MPAKLTGKTDEPRDSDDKRYFSHTADYGAGKPVPYARQPLIRDRHGDLIEASLFDHEEAHPPSVTDA